METGIAKAIRLAGSQTALGNMLGLTPQAIQKWATQGFVPADRCREVEEKLGGQVTRYELNASVFGDAPPIARSPRRRNVGV
ncbi:helix-turn-helix domain-containing protein [Massilia sp. UMI-21]|nr:helix-turn-helix domain-containing protein [Massilia sp. UMI-21]